MPFEGYKRRDENSGYLQAGVVPKTTENVDGTLTQHVNIDTMPSVSVDSMPTGSVTVNNFPSTYNVLFDAANQSAFGVLEVADLTPVLQGDFVHGLNTQTWQTGVASGTGAVVDTNASRLRVQSGTGATNFSYILSRRPIRYRAGEGIVFRSTPIFTTGVNGSVQLQGMGTIQSNAPYDGYFFGYSGTAFGIAHYNRGDMTWIPVANWNGDTVPNYDPTKGTPHFIKYPYLGYGDIFFFIQNPTTGHPELVHTIRYANTTTTTQISNPVLNFLTYVRNVGNTTNLTLYNGSYGAFISGPRSFIANPKWAADATKTGITTEALALSIRNCSSYNGVVNRGLIRIHSIGVGTNTNTYGVVRFKINATVGGSPVFNPVNGTSSQTGGVNDGITITSGNSIASVDVAGTTISGGTYIWNMPIGASSSSLMDVTPFEIFIAPGETLSITIFAANALAANISVNWSEDI